MVSLSKPNPPSTFTERVYSFVRETWLPLTLKLYRGYFRVLLLLTGANRSDLFPNLPDPSMVLTERFGLVKWPVLAAFKSASFVLKWARLLLVPDVFLRQLCGVAIIQVVYEILKASKQLSARLYEYTSKRGQQMARLRSQMKQANSYAEYRIMREKYEKLSRSRRNANELDSYSLDDLDNCARMQSKAKLYRDLVLDKDVTQLQFHLRAELLRKHWGVAKMRTFNRKPRLKKTLEDYMDVVCSALVLVAMSNDKPTAGRDRIVRLERRGSSSSCQDPHELLMQEVELTQQKLAFFNETRHSFGRSALLLSGGARMGLLHVGVIKSLMEQRMLPRVISGSSAGSIVAAMVGCLTDAEIKEKMFQPETLNLRFFGRKESHPNLRSAGEMEGFSATGLLLLLPPPFSTWATQAMKLVPRWLKHSTLVDGEVLGEAISSLTGDMTFQEAYDKTGRIINITVSPKNSERDFPLLLNYLTTPHVLVWSAAVASSAIPGVFAPVELLSKTLDGKIVPYSPEGLKWTDGSIENDLPMQRLSELFNVNHFIVSQVNAHARVLAPPIPSSESNNSVMSFMERMMTFLRDQVRSYLKHVTNFGLQLPILNAFGVGLVPILTQKYLGDITIMPEFSVKDLLSLLNNPTPQDFRVAILKGERYTWPLLPAIRMHCMIELMLDDCVHSVRKRLSMLERKASTSRMGIAKEVDMRTSEIPENENTYKTICTKTKQGGRKLAKQSSLSRVESYLAPSSSMKSLDELAQGSAKTGTFARGDNVVDVDDDDEDEEDVLALDTVEAFEEEILKREHDNLARRLQDRTKSVVGLAYLVSLGSSDKLPRLAE